jgi:predicted XRE-type DNA-binding protein
LSNYQADGIFATMTTKKTSLTEQLRQLIETAEMSRYELWQRTGIDQAVLSKFVNHKGGLSMESLDKIGELLDLQITKRPTTAKRRKGG